jgi:hypothetical protein
MFCVLCVLAGLSNFFHFSDRAHTRTRGVHRAEFTLSSSDSFIRMSASAAAAITKSTKSTKSTESKKRSRTARRSVRVGYTRTDYELDDCAVEDEDEEEADAALAMLRQMMKDSRDGYHARSREYEQLAHASTNSSPSANAPSASHAACQPRRRTTTANPYERTSLVRISTPTFK